MKKIITSLCIVIFPFMLESGHAETYIPLTVNTSLGIINPMNPTHFKNAYKAGYLLELTLQQNVTRHIGIGIDFGYGKSSPDRMGLIKLTRFTPSANPRLQGETLRILQVYPSIKIYANTAYRFRICIMGGFGYSRLKGGEAVLTQTLGSIEYLSYMGGYDSYSSGFFAGISFEYPMRKSLSLISQMKYYATTIEKERHQLLNFTMGVGFPLRLPM